MALCQRVRCRATVQPSLEDRVRQLQAIATKSEVEMSVLFPQLQAAIYDHIRYLRAIAVEVIPETFRKDNNVAD